MAITHYYTMTDTTRDLIQRLADELDNYRHLLMGKRRKTHPLANEARAYLAQSEPEEPASAMSTSAGVRARLAQADSNYPAKPDSSTL